MESQSDRQNNQPKTYCSSCKRYILTQNYLIHQGRCQRMSELRLNRASSSNDKSPQFNSLSKKQSQKSDHSKKQQKDLTSKYSATNLPKQFLGTTKKKSAIQQKISCHFCGYPQSLQELDTHPTVCQHWQISCPFCSSKYPKSLMSDHKQICSKNPENIRRNQINQMRRSSQEQNVQSDQEEFMPMFFRRRNRNLYRPSPLMDLFNMPFREGFYQQNQMIRQQPEPNFQIFQFSSNSNGQPRIFIHSNSSNPQTFIQLIQMLTRRVNPNQNPGLSEQQLNRLQKIHYKKNSEEQETDLCPICYCEFQEKQQIIQLSCKHLFHQECIFEWLKRVCTCPVCKKSMREVQQQQN